jgi:parvulin-like peptidyl-prolyl isomerase
MDPRARLLSHGFSQVGAMPWSAVRWATPSARLAPPAAALLLAPLVAAPLASCTSAPSEAAGIGASVAAAPAQAPARDAGGLVAMVDGKAIDFAALRPALVELAGQTALRDAVVDRRLAARLRGAGITVTDEHIERERALLLETLSPDAERARELLLGIRARQGLGESRFRALLARNAGLRALVEREVRLDDEGIANAFDVLHGPKRTARIAVVASLADAERLIADRAARLFADLAVERSLDESAARGGLLAPMARRDPSYPEPLRAAIFATAVGATSAPVLDGARYYVVEVLGESPADGTTPEAARAACERLLRLARERLLMDALARDLGALEGVTVFDRAFDPPAGG